MAPVLDHLSAAGDRFRAVFIGGGGLTLPRYLGSQVTARRSPTTMHRRISS